MTREITPDLVDEVIGLSGCREKRQRLLPARTVVCFVLGLCLFSGADSCAPPGYRSVMRWLTDGLRQMHGLALPTSSALTRARQPPRRRTCGRRTRRKAAAPQRRDPG